MPKVPTPINVVIVEMIEAKARPLEDDPYIDHKGMDWMIKLYYGTSTSTIKYRRQLMEDTGVFLNIGRTGQWKIDIPTYYQLRHKVIFG